MYEFLLPLHSWMRWLVLILAVATLFASFAALKDDSKANAVKKSSLFFLIAVDLQFTVGLILYMISPIVQGALSTGAAMMKDASLRFWAVEHFSAMFVAVAVMHVGRVLVKKRAKTPAGYAKGTLIYVLIFLILVAATIPWPDTPQGRPLFRAFF